MKRKPNVRSDAERNALFLANRGLVGFCLGRLGGAVTVIGQERAIDLAEETLLRCAALWDPARGVKFSTYAVFAIRSRLFREVRRLTSVNNGARPRPVTLSLEGFPDRELVEGADQEEPADVAAANEREDVLRRLLRAARLPARELAAVRGLVDRTPLKELGAKLNVSRERVRQLRAQGLARLRRVCHWWGLGVDDL